MICKCLYCWAERSEYRETIYGLAEAFWENPQLTIAQVAEKLSVPKWLAKEARVRMGLARTVNPGNAHPPEMRAKVLAMLDDGCSYAEIARSLRMSVSTLVRWFPGRGFTREQHAERSRLNLLEMRLDGRLSATRKKAA